MFRSSTILRELVWSLVKVTLYFVRLCGAVAACLESDMCVVCCAAPHNLRTKYNVTLARLHTSFLRMVEDRNM
jgi:hypothetical protein